MLTGTRKAKGLSSNEANEVTRSVSSTAEAPSPPDDRNAATRSVSPTASTPSSPNEHLEAALGETIGRYQVRRELGRGGMASVYLARDVVLGRSVALKIVGPGK